MRTRKLARSHEPEIVVADGDFVLRQGDLGTDMYVITAGRVRVTRHQNGEVVDLGERGRGEFFGEMSLLESLPRAADVQAVGEARLLVITQGQLLVRLRRDPTFSLELLRQLSGELRRQHPDGAAFPGGDGSR